MFITHPAHPCRGGARVSQLIVAYICASAAALLLAIILCFAAPLALADGGSDVAQFSIRPVAQSSTTPPAPYFVFNLQAGATIHSQVRITNTGTARGSVALYPVDATTGQTSGVVYRSRQDRRADVGSWVTVGTSQLTLDPKQSQTVAFTVTVPASVRPGQHVGGLVAENLALQNGSGTSPSSGVQINIQHLSIVAVQVNLPGPQAQRLDATSLQPGGQHSYQILFLNLRNTGTQMLKPSGTLRVTDTAGHQLKLMQLTLDTVLPQTVIAYPVYVDGQALSAGHYKGVLSLTYGSPQLTLSRTFDFVVTAASLQQVFGGKAPNAPPSLTSAGFGGVPTIAALAGGAALLLLAGLGTSMILMPRLRRSR